MALLAGEKPHDPLTATRLGSYYDLMVPYVLGSGVFGPGDRARGVDDRLPAQARRDRDGDDPAARRTRASSTTSRA